MCDNSVCFLKIEITFLLIIWDFTCSSTPAQYWKNADLTSEKKKKNTARKRILSPGRIIILHMPSLWLVLRCFCLYVHSSSLNGLTNLSWGNKAWIQICRWRCDGLINQAWWRREFFQQRLGLYPADTTVWCNMILQRVASWMQKGLSWGVPGHSLPGSEWCGVLVPLSIYRPFHSKYLSIEVLEGV